MFSIKIAFLSMIALVAASNFLVQFPLGEWLTWGAFPYPMTFMVTELTNRYYGPKKARQIVYVGFTIAVILSIWLSTPKIAFASGLAFLTSQLLDIYVFNRLRQQVWWCAPLCASVMASLIDATTFWSFAFWGENLPILTWAIGDTSVKLAVDIVMLMPFRVAIRKISLSGN